MCGVCGPLGAFGLDGILAVNVADADPAVLLIASAAVLAAAVALPPICRRIALLDRMPGTIGWSLAVVGLWLAAGGLLLEGGSSRLKPGADGDFALWFNAVPAAVLAAVVIRVLDVLIVHVLLPWRGGITVPGVLHEVVLLLAYFIAAMVFAQTWLNLDVSTLLAGSAVVSVILGFGLQETLGNLFAGVTLHVGSPFAIGDWIRIGSVEGRVTEMNWRATSLTDFSDNMISIPNATLSKSEIINYSRPAHREARNVIVGLEYDVPPDRAIAALERAAAATPRVLPSPAPYARLEKFADSDVDYLVKFWIDDHREWPRIEADVRRHIWYELKRSRLNIPFPIRTVEWTDAAARRKADDEAAAADRFARLRRLPLFAPLDDRGIEALSRAARVETFGDGEVVCRQGDTDTTLYLITRGRVAVAVATGPAAEPKPPAGGGNGGWSSAFLPVFASGVMPAVSGPASAAAEVARLGPGDFFGEMSLLTGDPRRASVTAVGDVELIALGKADLAPLLAANPEMMVRISEIMAERQAGLAKVRTAEDNPPARAAAARNLLERMRRFFDWS